MSGCYRDFATLSKNHHSSWLSFVTNSANDTVFIGSLVIAAYKSISRQNNAAAWGYANTKFKYAKTNRKERNAIHRNDANTHTHTRRCHLPQNAKLNNFQLIAKCVIDWIVRRWWTSYNSTIGALTATAHACNSYNVHVAQWPPLLRYVFSTILMSGPRACGVVIVLCWMVYTHRKTMTKK